MAPLSPKRRRFQPPITNFFTASNPNDVTAASQQQQQASNYLAASSHSVQASLLTVGMRVRKSVPEGYKTTAKSKNFLDASVFPGSSAPVSSTSSSSPYANDTHSSYGHNTTGFAELAPFCGVLKTGGLSVQPFSSYHSNHDNYDDGFPSSQESCASDFSTDSMPANNAAIFNANKRTIDDFDEEEQDEEEPEYTQTPPQQIRLGNMYNASRPMHALTQEHTNRRLYAQPKSRNGKMGGLQQSRVAFGNAGVMEVGMEDFEEAEFLCRKEELDAMEI